MKRQMTRVIQTVAIVFGVLIGSYGAIAPKVEANTGLKSPAKVDLGISGVCRQLRAPIGTLVSVTNHGTASISNITVQGTIIYSGGELVEQFVKTLPVASLQSGASALVKFAGDEIRDPGGSGYVIHFSVESTQSVFDTNPSNDERSFTSFTSIRPCPLTITPTLNG